MTELVITQKVSEKTPQNGEKKSQRPKCVTVNCHYSDNQKWLNIELILTTTLLEVDLV